MADIAILGSGGWGTALAVALNANGHNVTLWSPFEQEVEILLRDREQKKLLAGIKIDEKIAITTDINCAAGKDMIIIATPSFAVRSTAHLLKNIAADGDIVVNVAKGVESGTFMRLSQVVIEELPDVNVACLSGPSHAEEVAKFIPTSLVAASTNRAAAEKVQDIVISSSLRVYTNDDIVGVELGGAFKNIIALATGICDGMGLGDNTKAALMTRGLTEIARLGVAMGAREETFAGLAGVGDLIVTCTSMHSRNRRFGICIGQGMTPADALESVGMTVEGYHATKTAKELSAQYGVEMPIVEQCYAVLYEGRPISEVLKNLMGRPKKHEKENIWM